MGKRYNDLLIQRGVETEIQNYRPITLLNVIYKICQWFMGGKLSVIMNIFTTELQTA